jgi:hypothetical protein
MAKVEGLRAAAVFYWMGCLLSGPRADDLHPAARDDHRTELAVCWANWREVVERLSRDVEIENAARAQLQRRYFGGREVFFADTGQAWAEHVDLVDRLERLAQGLTPPAKPSSRRCSPRTDGIASLEDRIAQRVEVLADDARVRAFGIMGERDRAVGIMERRLVAD